MAGIIDPIATADRLYRERRLRNAAFEGEHDGFVEPAWDMLLGLLAYEAVHPRPTAEEVIGWASAPASIARTYLDWLASRDFVTVTDGKCVTLTARGRTRLTAYFSALETLEDRT